ncbi:MAG: hypothetical protein JRC86_00780 [Deltaproteobacteria bacterium]|nr:hypothetical protein [Deltaproteobacteria bacterium]
MSSAFKKMFKTANALETHGIDIEYGESLQIKVARAGGANKKFTKTLTRLTKVHRAAIAHGIITDEVADGIVLQAYAETVILNWSGVMKDILTDDDADAETALECTVENIIAVMKALPDLFADIQKVSQELATFRAETMEQDAKN